MRINSNRRIGLVVFERQLMMDAIGGAYEEQEAAGDEVERTDCIGDFNFTRQRINERLKIFIKKF